MEKKCSQVTRDFETPSAHNSFKSEEEVQPLISIPCEHEHSRSRSNNNDNLWIESWKQHALNYGTNTKTTATATATINKTTINKTTTTATTTTATTTTTNTTYTNQLDGSEQLESSFLVEKKYGNEDIKKNEVGSSITSSSSSFTKPVSFYALLRNNGRYCTYLSSYVLSHAGEWFTYVASIELLENLTDHSDSSKLYISILMSLRLIPHVLVSPFGGIISDSQDRRHTMILLDRIGAFISLLYILADHFQSIPLVYLVAFSQSTVGAIYEPCRQAIIPMLVTTNNNNNNNNPSDDNHSSSCGIKEEKEDIDIQESLEKEYTKKAIVMSELSWSLIAAFGSALGGLVVALMGIRACFVMDCISYLLSSIILSLIKGTYDAPSQSQSQSQTFTHPSPHSSYDAKTDNNDYIISNENNQITSTLQSGSIPESQPFQVMAYEGLMYIQNASLVPLLFLKFSAALLYGASDVISVSFSEIDTTPVTTNNGTNTDCYRDCMLPSEKLGILLFSLGMGCLSGSLLAETLPNLHKPNMLQNLCVYAMALILIGFLGMGLFRPFPCLIFFTLVRAGGSSIVWIYSSVLLQKYSDTDMYGRVSAVDYGLATLSEAFSALIGGTLLDHFHMTARSASLFMAFLGCIIFPFWLKYLWLGKLLPPIRSVRNNQGEFS